MVTDGKVVGRWMRFAAGDTTDGGTIDAEVSGNRLSGLSVGKEGVARAYVGCKLPAGATTNHSFWGGDHLWTRRVSVARDPGNADTISVVV